MENKTNASQATIVPPLPSPALAGKEFLLASQSPRRRELLGMILPEFKIAVVKDVEEVYPADMPPEEVPCHLSRLKAEAYASLLQKDEIIITADTVVISEGKILGKPADRNQAISMLQSLRGRAHTVVTGVTLSSTEKSETFAESTTVRFGDISDSEIERYVDYYRPYDKAGAYGIQEWIGAAAVCGIDGCYYNVMGLPLHALYGRLRDF